VTPLHAAAEEPRRPPDPDASKLRENVYRILDETIDAGFPVEVER
jgi:hypothetical protein